MRKLNNQEIASLSGSRNIIGRNLRDVLEERRLAKHDQHLIVDRLKRPELIGKFIETKTFERIVVQVVRREN
jgi:SHS2 domain-containing protein